MFILSLPIKNELHERSLPLHSLHLAECNKQHLRMVHHDTKVRAMKKQIELRVRKQQVRDEWRKISHTITMNEKGKKCVPATHVMVQHYFKSELVIAFTSRSKHRKEVSWSRYIVPFSIHPSILM
jgi:hypothetical protein